MSREWGPVTSSENPLSPPPIGQWSSNTAPWDTFGGQGTDFRRKVGISLGRFGIFMARMNAVLTCFSISHPFTLREEPKELLRIY